MRVPLGLVSPVLNPRARPLYYSPPPSAYLSLGFASNDLYPTLLYTVPCYSSDSSGPIVSATLFLASYRFRLKVNNNSRLIKYNSELI
ncbi:uncharacterized protein RSE6_04683 [Rhynchosporium secalis]|uniref:Uncharacterized protein n=1 Tax=Rhynchosporium secalis TaxID=38038 RepID=A0A1E1M5Y1_RHYSE|nr:uncharacterized protein RSE6_04683 [Rhynchosporium secalis]